MELHPSPFKKAAILTIDGVGEWATTTSGVGNRNEIRINKEIRFPQSIGLLYSAFTAFLGFEVNEGEWKVMGLAPYGKPRYQDLVWKTVKANDDGSFSLDFKYFAFPYSDRNSYTQKFIDLFGPPILKEESHLITKRAADIAASIQVVTEDLILNLAKNLHQETKLDNLCLAGGVALNSVANYRLLKESGFKSIFIQPAAGDSEGTLGAALYVYHQVLGNKKREQQTHAYFGQEYSNKEIEKFLKSQKQFFERSEKFISNNRRVPQNIPYKFSLRSNNNLHRVRYTQLPPPKLIDFITDKIIAGKVIGWFQGKFEWGPRALGSRSILADPGKAEMKDVINAKVKFREAFRPFAPSALAEKADLVFDISNKHINQWPLQYMLYVVPVRKDWRKKVAAINHIDNTARPQLVDKKVNPLYYALINAFYKKTGVPLVLNTSFNLRGEPIVGSVQDAYSTFQRSGIDILVLGNYVVEK